MQLQSLLGYDRPHPGFDITGSLDPPAITRRFRRPSRKLCRRARTTRPPSSRSALADANVKLAYAEGTTDPTIEGEYDRTGTQTPPASRSVFRYASSIAIRVRRPARSTKHSPAALRRPPPATRWSPMSIRHGPLMKILSLARRYNGHYLQEAHEVRDNLEYSYRHGGTTLLDYLSALQDYRQVNLDALNANMQVWLSLHQAQLCRCYGDPSMRPLRVCFPPFAASFVLLFHWLRRPKEPPLPPTRQLRSTASSIRWSHTSNRCTISSCLPHAFRRIPTTVVHIYPPDQRTCRSAQGAARPGGRQRPAVGMLQSTDPQQARSDYEKAKIEAARADLQLNRARSCCSTR